MILLTVKSPDLTAGMKATHLCKPLTLGHLQHGHHGEGCERVHLRMHQQSEPCMSC